MRKNDAEKVCALCGKTFIGNRSAKYCDECRPKAYFDMYTRSRDRARDGTARKLDDVSICERCGKEYFAVGYSQKYCCPCQQEMLKVRAEKHYLNNRQKCIERSGKRQKRLRTENPPAPKQEKICPQCGKTFAAYGTKVYCSVDCRKKYKPEEKTERICPQCGTTFLASGKKTYCSAACQYRYNSLKRSKTHRS